MSMSFCERARAGSQSQWHLRELTDKGRCLGGGADTKALCGAEVAWDLDVEITPFHLRNNACLKCMDAITHT